MGSCGWQGTGGGYRLAGQVMVRGRAIEVVVGVAVAVVAPSSCGRGNIDGGSGGDGGLGM